MTNPTRASAATRVSDATGQALDATTHALDSGRQFATEAANRIGETARDVGDSAADLARRSAESVSEATIAAQRQLEEYARATRNYVAREPWTSALVAAAIGAAVAVLAVTILRSRRDAD